MFTHSVDGFEDLVCRFGPYERLGIVVVEVEVAFDLEHQIADAGERCPADLFLSKGGEPSFDLVEPRGTGWREVQMKARVANKPSANGSVLVCAIVVQDHMDVELGRDTLVDKLEELQKLLVTVPSIAFPDHFAACHIKGSEEAGNAMAVVVVSPTLALARPHRQQRLGTLERLDLALFVNAEHQSVVWRVQVQPTDITHFLDEQRVAA